MSSGNVRLKSESYKRVSSLNNRTSGKINKRVSYHFPERFLKLLITLKLTALISQVIKLLISEATYCQQNASHDIF
jgi:hypothetical protein